MLNQRGRQGPQAILKTIHKSPEPIRIKIITTLERTVAEPINKYNIYGRLRTGDMNNSLSESCKIEQIPRIREIPGYFLCRLYKTLNSNVISFNTFMSTFTSILMI